MMRVLQPENWIDEYADQLYAYCLQRINNKQQAEDMVQDTFLNAWRARETYSGEASEKNWLFTILKNKMTDYFRSKKNAMYNAAADIDYFDNHGNWTDEQAPQQWPAEFRSPMDNKEFNSILEQCKSKLKDIQHQVFVLKYLDDYKAEDICELLGITPSNYWILIHRAKLQLRKCIEKNWVNI